MEQSAMRPRLTAVNNALGSGPPQGGEPVKQARAHAAFDLFAAFPIQTAASRLAWKEAIDDAEDVGGQPREQPVESGRHHRRHAQDALCLAVPGGEDDL